MLAVFITKILYDSLWQQCHLWTFTHNDPRRDSIRKYYEFKGLCTVNIAMKHRYIYEVVIMKILY